MAEKPNFLVIGAGGIGAYYGARLQDAGHEVTFIARGPHLRALQENGLRVEHPDFRFDEQVNALSMDQLVQACKADSFTLLVLTTKAGTTQGIMEQLGSWLGGQNGPSLLSLQNGIDNENQIASFVGGRRTIGGLAVRIGGHVMQPGLIEARGPAQVILGAWPNLSRNEPGNTGIGELVDTFIEAGIPTRASDDIRLELWKKLLINNGVNPLSALTELDTRTLSNHPQLGNTVYRLMQEAALAARADDVEITGSDVDAMFELICTFDPIKTSMLVDYEKGRTLELEEIAGAVIDRCRKIGEPAPFTELVKALLDLKLAR